MSVDTEGMSFEAALEAARAQAAARQPTTAEGTAPEASSGETAAQEAAPSQPAEPVHTPPAGGASNEPPRQEAAAPEAPSDPGKPPEGAPVDPAIKRLLDREARLQEREKEIAKLESAKRKFKYNPVAAIRDIAPEVSLSEIAKVLWVEELGDLAPPEAKQAKEFRGVRSEVEELRVQVEEERRRLAEEYARQQQELAMNQYAGAIKSVVSSLEDGKYPLVKGFHKKHSDGVVDELLTIAQQHARTAGEILTPEELVGKLETYLGRYQVVEAPTPAPAPPPVDKAPQETKTQTLRNTHTQVQPSLQPADELDDEFLRNKALQAVREDRKRRGLG